ncbi:hypothetical protein D3C81_1097630 [compost metagenome]
MFFGELVHRREEGVVLRGINVRDAGLEESQLQVAHFLPVDYFGVQVELEAIDNAFDIVNRFLRVPASIDMEYQRPQTQFLLRDIRQVGTVDATAHANDAIEILAFAGNLDGGGELVQLLLATRIRVPVWGNFFLESGAVITDPVRVKGNL